jgi:hypothetical protein
MIEVVHNLRLAYIHGVPKPTDLTANHGWWGSTRDIPAGFLARVDGPFFIGKGNLPKTLLVGLATAAKNTRSRDEGKTSPLLLLSLRVSRKDRHFVDFLEFLPCEHWPPAAHTNGANVFPSLAYDTVQRHAPLRGLSR